MKPQSFKSSLWWASFLFLFLVILSFDCMFSCSPCFVYVRLISSLLYSIKTWWENPSPRSRSTSSQKSASLLKILSVHFFSFFLLSVNPPFQRKWADLLWLSFPFIHNRCDNASHPSSSSVLASLFFFFYPHIPFFFRSSEKERRLATGIKIKNQWHILQKRSADSMDTVIVQAREFSTVVLSR